MRKIKLLCLIPSLSIPLGLITSCSSSEQEVQNFEVKFYCGNILVDTQTVKKGDCAKVPQLDDFTVYGWYSDSSLTTKFDVANTNIESNINLYGDFIAKITYGMKNSPSDLADYGYGVSNNKVGEVYVSNASLYASSFIKLKDRGIIFNKTSVGKIKTIRVNIDELGFKDAYLYCGDQPLSFKYSYQLHGGENEIDVSDKDVFYFVIQSQGSEIFVDECSIDYVSSEIPTPVELPIININTNGKEITSKEEYVESTISSKDTVTDLDNVVAGVRLRGNSTLQNPKKAYRIKFDKKQSLFGLEKAKNWVLLADYCDTSKMHNYAALKFAQLFKGDDEFCPSPFHVRLFLNGVDMGIYLFTEHIDEKSGRMDLAQDEIWNFTSLDQFNFMVERDISILAEEEPTEIEGRDYFKIDRGEEYPEIYCLKYPTIDDFVETTQEGQTISHETEFYNYFNMLKTYITTVSDLMYQYSTDASKYSEIVNYIDTKSLAEYGAIDQMFLEKDHKNRSFKFYRNVNKSNLIKFGPNWDYDAGTMGLPLSPYSIVSKPYNYFEESINSTRFKESWSYSLFSDNTNGFKLFKNIWSNITIEDIDSYISDKLIESNKISPYCYYDCANLYKNRYSSTFDGIMYANDFLKNHAIYLKNFYQNK